MTAEEYNALGLERGLIRPSDFVELVRHWQEAQGLHVDGKLGPNTVASLRAWQPRPELHSIAGDADAGSFLMLKTLEFNVSEYGEGETDGNNQGYRIDYWRETDGTGIGVGGSGPWCGTVQSSSLQRAAAFGDMRLPCRTSRNAKRLGDNVGRAGRYITVPEIACFVVWHRGQNPAQGHIGQALSYDLETDMLRTVEGNRARPGESRAYMGEFEYPAGSWRDDLYCLSTLSLPPALT